MVDQQADRWNFRVLLGQGVFLDVSQTLASPRLVLPFLYIALGAPVIFSGLLIPIVLLSRMIGQITSAPFVSSSAISKWYLALGILTGATALAVIGLAAQTTSMELLAIVFLTVAIIVGLGQGLSRLAFQNMLGYIVPIHTRRTLLFTQTAVSGLLAIGVAWTIHVVYPIKKALEGHLALLWVGIGVSLLSGFLSMLIKEGTGTHPENIAPVKTRSQTSFIVEIRKGIGSVIHVSWFRRFIVIRILFLCVELAMPFYAIHAAGMHMKTSGSLSIFVIAASLGLVAGGPLWHLCSRWQLSRIMSLAAIIAACGGLVAIANEHWDRLGYAIFYAVVFFLISIADQGWTVARKIYLATFAPAKERAYYIAVSDTLVGGIAVLVGFLLGTVAHQQLVWPIVILGIINVVAALYALRLPPINASENGP